MEQARSLMGKRVKGSSLKKQRPTSVLRGGLFNIADVQSAFGPKLVAYVKKKTTGGAAGQKGSRYEDRLAILKIGQAAETAFSRNGAFSESRNVSFQSQAPCFVDDILIFHRHSRTAHHFQAKNAVSVSWSKGPKSLASDFRNQLILGKSRCFTTKLYLVVSGKKLAQNLNAAIPKDLKKYASVEYFPADVRLLTLLNYKPMREALTALLGPQPTDDHLVSMGRLLMGAWSEAGNAITLKKLMEELHRSNAPLVRPLKPVINLDPRLRAVLNCIPHFRYAVEKGYFVWNYGTTDTGCFETHCGTPRFSAFAQRIISRRPRTFWELEEEFR